MVITAVSAAIAVAALALAAYVALTAHRPRRREDGPSGWTLEELTRHGEELEAERRSAPHRLRRRLRAAGFHLMRRDKS